MTSIWSWTCNSLKISVYAKHLSSKAQILTSFALWPSVFKLQGFYPRGPNFGPFRFTTSCFRDTRISKSEISEMHQMSPAWPGTLERQSALHITHTLSTYHTKPKSWLVSLYGQTFCGNPKCAEWLQNDLEHVTDKSTMFTLNTYPRDPKFGPFSSTTSRFWDTRLSKIGMHRIGMHRTYEFCGMNLLCNFRENVWKFSSRMVPC